MRPALRIVASAPVPRIAVEAFARLGEITVIDGPLDPALSNADVLIARADPIDERLLAAGPALRAIARTGAGLDSIDLEAVTRRGIPVLYVPDAGTLAMAEGTLALILAALKRLPALSAVVAERRWSERYEQDVLDIAGTTLGVVGFGRIGRQVARLAHAIGMNVIAYDPHTDAVAQGWSESGAQARSLEQVFAEAEVITLHCPLTEATRHLVDRDLLSITKPGAVLVNASRGGIIAGDAVLLEALEAGQLSAVALDVFPVEPPQAGPLLSDRRVLCTPHVVGLTRAWNRGVFESLAADVTRLFANERPKHIANPEVLDRGQPVA